MKDYKSLELSAERKIFFYLCVMAASLFVGWLFYDNLFSSIPIAALLAELKTKYAKMIRRKEKSKLTLQFKDIMYSITAFIASGRSLSQSLEESIEFWRGTYDEKDYMILELKNMTKRMREGGERDVDLLRELAERSDIEDIRDFVMVCDTCKKTGGDFPKAVSRCADIIGDKMSMERELSVMAAQKRFEGRIIGMAPFFIIFFIKLMSPEYLHPLNYTPEGRMIATMALLMIGTGFLLMERMNEIEF